MLTNKNRVFRGLNSIRPVIAVCAILLLVGCQPPGPKSLLLGEKYLEQGNYEKALKYLIRASELMPEHPQVWNYLGLAYHGAKQPAQAADKYHRAIRINRNLPAPHYNLGSLLLEEGHLPQAVAELKLFVTLHTNSAPGWTKLGTALVRMRRPDDAEYAFTQALRIDPKDPEAHNGMGLAHIQRKRPREAMLSFNNALQYRTGYSAALLNQAIIAQQHFGNKQMALERYKAYLSTKPDAKSAVEVQKVVHELEQEIAGVQIAQDDLAEAPPSARAETNAFTAALQSNAPPKTAVMVSNPPAPAITNLAVRPAPTVKTNLAQNPQTTAATNALATANAQQITNAAPPRATNAVATAATNVTKEPKELIRVAAKAPEVKPQPEAKPTSELEQEPESEPPLTVEVVAVEKEPEFRPVEDLAPVKPVVTPTSPTTASAPPVDSRPLIVTRRERKQEEKPGFFSKVNPVRWFKDDEKENGQEKVAPQNAPIATPPRAETVPPARPSYPPVVKVIEPKPEPPRVIARYQYRRPAPLKEGNRAAAEKVFQMGAQAHQRKRLDEAMAAYQNATSIDPSFFDAHYNLGLAAYQSRNLPLALSANELALAAQPKSKDARYNFSLALREAGYPADAANELRTLVTEYPDEARGHFTLANLYAQQLDQPTLARKHYLKVLELSPNHSEAGSIRHWLANNQ